MQKLDEMTAGNHQAHPFRVTYPDDVEQAIAVLEPVVGAKLKGALNSRWVSLKLLDYDDSPDQRIKHISGNRYFTG